MRVFTDRKGYDACDFAVRDAGEEPHLNELVMFARQLFQRVPHVVAVNLGQHEVVCSRFEHRLGGRRDRLAANRATAQRIDRAIACDPTEPPACQSGFRRRCSARRITTYPTNSARVPSTASWP